MIETWHKNVSSVSIRRIINKFVNVCRSDYTAAVANGKVERSVNRFNHTSGVTAVTPTDRPKSVRNHCVIDVFGDVYCVVTLFFWIFLWVNGILS